MRSVYLSLDYLNSILSFHLDLYGLHTNIAPLAVVFILAGILWIDLFRIDINSVWATSSANP